MASSRLCLSQCDESEKSSVTNKFQQKYWKTKQTLIRVTGKREDEHVVASDAELDSKLEVFHSVQRTCLELLKVIEQYQQKINFLSQEENELGRFLRSQGSQDRSRAGKMMQATGKALCLSSQQRLALRGPLSRLHQELETFRFRAVSDTWLTVNRMEQSRTDYRGALLWMKDVSQELDPDTHKQMEKFRKVQTQVRQTKTNFDKLKMDVCQKVDVLGASRCNLLSHVLTNYQTTLLHYWEKTSHTMAAIHENFRMEIPATTKTKEKKKRKSDPEEEKNKSDEMLISVDGENSTAGECVTVEQEKDELSLLSEILGSACVDEGGWSEMFGEEALTNKNPAEMLMLEEDSSIFLPSRLLDQNTSLTRPAVSETSSRDRWFDLFADLDPLSNPDAVGRRENDELLNA